jgi:hypothetical protein
MIMQVHAQLPAWVRIDTFPLWEDVGHVLTPPR